MNQKELNILNQVDKFINDFVPYEDDYSPLCYIISTNEEFKNWKSEAKAVLLDCPSSQLVQNIIGLLDYFRPNHEKDDYHELCMLLHQLVTHIEENNRRIPPRT